MSRKGPSPPPLRRSGARPLGSVPDTPSGVPRTLGIASRSSPRARSRQRRAGTGTAGASGRRDSGTKSSSRAILQGPTKDLDAARSATRHRDPHSRSVGEALHLERMHERATLGDPEHGVRSTSLILEPPARWEVLARLARSPRSCATTRRWLGGYSGSSSGERRRSPSSTTY
jgi:hypothetical protein